MLLALYAITGLGLGFVPLLVSIWRIPALEMPGTTAVSAYRADRLTTVIYGVACAPAGALLGILALIPAYGSARWLAGTLLFALGGAVFCWVIRGTSYSLLKLTELALAAQWRDRVRFLHLLEEAAKQGVVRQADTGAGYEFRDGALRAHLAALGQAALAADRQKQARRPARARIGSKIAAVVPRRVVKRAAVLPDRLISRVSWDLGAGTAIFVTGGIADLHWFSGSGFPGMLEGIVKSAFLGVLAGAFTFGTVTWALAGAAGGARWALANASGSSRGVRLAAAVTAGAAGVALVAEAGTGLATFAAAVLPAAFVAACGLWACVLTLPKARKSSRRWLQAVPDVIATAATCACLLAVADRKLLATQPAAGLLFPPAVWGSIRIWRVMRSSGRLTVKAGADITLSLLLGAGLVLILVWLANLLGLPGPEMAVLRALLKQAGSAADVPWWAWTGLYVLLAAAGLAFARWPGRLTKLIRWFQQLHLARAADVIRRSLTCVHIGLLVTVLVGLAAPAALAPTLQRQTKAAYTVALQREFEADGELAAYKQIRRTFHTTTPAPALAAIIQEIHDVSSPPAGDRDATSTETDLARRLGELQAATLALKAPPSLRPAEQSAASRAGFSDPARSASGLSGRLGKLDEQGKKDNEAARRAEQAGDLAAAAVASTLSIPHISGNEAFQIIREYLSGLIEGSPLKDLFAAWTERLSGGSHPPDADTMIIPDPGQIERAASAALSGEFATDGLTDPVTDPLATDPALTRALTESPIAAAVDLANQARYLEENSGPCTGCTRPENSGGHPALPPEDHPAEP